MARKECYRLTHPLSNISELNEARDDGVWGWQWHQLDHMQTICTSLQTDSHTNTSSLNFYRPDAVPDPPTNSVKALTAQYDAGARCQRRSHTSGIRGVSTPVRKIHNFLVCDFLVLST